MRRLSHTNIKAWVHETALSLKHAQTLTTAIAQSEHVLAWQAQARCFLASSYLALLYLVALSLCLSHQVSVGPSLCLFSFPFSHSLSSPQKAQP